MVRWYKVRRYMLYISTYISMVRWYDAICCIYISTYISMVRGTKYDAICCIYQHIYPWYDGTSTAHNNSINITIPAEKLLSFHNLYF